MDGWILELGFHYLLGRTWACNTITLAHQLEHRWFGLFGHCTSPSLRTQRRSRRKRADARTGTTGFDTSREIFYAPRMAKKAVAKETVAASRLKSSALVDTRKARQDRKAARVGEKAGW
jgi:hypothetical protein